MQNLSTVKPRGKKLEDKLCELFNAQVLTIK